MKHFSTEEWVDFVNQVIASNQREAMQKHLATGCKRCMETVSLWQKVSKTAAAEASYQPSADTVRLAKAAYLTTGLNTTQKEPRNLIEVLFDSFLQPAVAGARSVVIGTRQMLYRADPYQIDIQIEPKPGSNRLVITGQLTRPQPSRHHWPRHSSDALKSSWSQRLSQLQISLANSPAKSKTPATWSFPSPAMAINPSSFPYETPWATCPEASHEPGRRHTFYKGVPFWYGSTKIPCSF